jgi:hypothetical protein
MCLREERVRALVTSVSQTMQKTDFMYPLWEKGLKLP